MFTPGVRRFSNVFGSRYLNWCLLVKGRGPCAVWVADVFARAFGRWKCVTITIAKLSSVAEEQESSDSEDAPPSISDKKTSKDKSAFA